MMKMAFIAMVLLNYDPSSLFGWATPPGVLVWAWENKGYACMMAFFLGRQNYPSYSYTGHSISGNAVENGLISTGAFEIYLSGDQLWSKLDTGRIPSQSRVLKFQQFKFLSMVQE